MTTANKEELRQAIVKIVSQYGKNCSMYGSAKGVNHNIPVDKILALLEKAEREAREEQIMQDFNSLNIQDLTDFYENDLIDWRIAQLKALQDKEVSDE